MRRNVQQTIAMMRSRQGGCSSGSVAAHTTAVKHSQLVRLTQCNRPCCEMCVTAHKHSQLCAVLSPADRVGGVLGRGVS